MSSINMSEKQSETAANPETYQADGGQLRPDPEMPSDGELQQRDAGHSQHEASDVPDRNSSRTDRLSGESRQVQPNPEAKAGGHSDAQSTIREPSDGDGDTMRTEGSGVSERKSILGPLPDIRRERDSVRDIGIGKMAYFVVHDTRGSVDAHCESGGIGERSHTTAGQSTSHDPLEKDPDRLGVSQAHGGTRCLGDDGLLTASSSDHEQGYSSDSLLLPDARKKGRLYLQVNPAISKSRRSTVWYVQPAPRGRDIFEAGGDESQNPRLKPLGGVVPDGSDRIERLPVEESPVVETTPVASVATSRSWTDSLGTAMFVPLGTCLCFLWRSLEVQFSKAPIFYVLSAIVVVFSLVFFFGKEDDLDILMCLLTTVAVCIVLTVAVPRGGCAKMGDKMESVVFSGLSGLCGECCSRREETAQPARRHSKYYHPLEEEAHTAFEHEVADVSNIDPKDCPQMRTVDDQEIVKSESPDFPPDFRQLNVDIHAPDSPRNSEEVQEAAGRKQGAIKKLAKTRTKNKSKSSTTPLKPPKISKAEEVPIPQREGQLEDLSNADRIRNIPGTNDASSTLKSTLTSLIETAAAYNAKGFVCEHDGQGVACSCFADRRKQND